ncbi:MAG: T9SS type A sorting domain-containing protein, partial [Bacteroidota bacterium]
PSAFITAEGDLTTGCVGDTLFLNAGTAPEGYTYQWYEAINLLEGANDSTVAVTSAGSYYVILEGACESPQSNWLFTEFVGPDLFLQAPSTVCVGSSFDLNDLDLIDLGNSGGTITFHSGTPADSSNLLDNSVVSIEEATLYYVLATEGNCSDELVVTLDVYPALEMPMIALDTALGQLSVPAIFSTYQWYDADGPIEGETMTTYFPSTFGTYTVLVSDDNGCTVFSEVFENTIVSNIDLEAELSVALFPNPFHTKLSLSIETLDRKTLDIQLLDVLGQSILREQHQVLGSINIDFDLPGLTSGLYFLMIENEEGRLVRKLIKE